jgi:hypothetical protein
LLLLSSDELSDAADGAPLACTAVAGECSARALSSPMIDQEQERGTSEAPTSAKMETDVERCARPHAAGDAAAAEVASDVSGGTHERTGGNTARLSV